MKKLFVGIDVSKDVFDFCVINEDHQVLVSKGKFPNSIDGINDLCSFIESFKDYEPWYCLEHTGYYGALLSSEFAKRNLCYSLINPLEIKLSIGIARGKNDTIDAYRIANYGVVNTFKLEKFILPTEHIQKLKALMTIRDGYSKILVQLKNSHKAFLILGETIDLKEQINENELLIKNQELAIKKVEKEMNFIIKSNMELTEKYDKVTKVIGVGPLTAIKCIIETENFTKFVNGRKFSCHCGLAPFEYSSGSSVRGRTRTSVLSNKSLKSIFYKAACTAIQHDPQLKNYYSRKLQEGKHKLSIINAVANKIVLRVFAVVKRNKPFVKFSA